MSTVIAHMSMSPDGFIEDCDRDVGRRLLGWTTSGRSSSTVPGDGRGFRTSKASAELLREAMAGNGALVCGRRLFERSRDGTAICSSGSNAGLQSPSSGVLT